MCDHLAAGARPLAAHVWAKEEFGFYVDPKWTSARLFEAEHFAGDILDPCCGIGHIADSARAAGHRVIATDLVDRGYEHFDGVADFLRCRQRIDNIVCNPPYQLCRDFARHALDLANAKVAMIWLARRLNAARWLRDTPLARIYFITPRPSMPPGQVIAAGEKPAGGRQDFTWLIWERAHVGPPTAHWLCREVGRQQS